MLSESGSLIRQSEVKSHISGPASKMQHSSMTVRDCLFIHLSYRNGRCPRSFHTLRTQTSPGNYGLEHVISEESTYSLGVTLYLDCQIFPAVKTSFDLSGKAVVLPLCMGSLWKLSRESTLETEVSFPPLACFCSALAKAHAHLSSPFPTSLHKMAESKALDEAGRTTWLNNSQLRKKKVCCCFSPSLSSWPCSSSGSFCASSGTFMLCPNSQTLQKMIAAPGNELIWFKAGGTASMRTRSVIKWPGGWTRRSDIKERANPPFQWHFGPA